MKSGGEEINMLEMLSISALDIQQGFFKMTMKNQVIVVMQLPIDLNPLIRLWNTISSSTILCHNLLEYLKLAEIGSILVFGVWKMKDVSPL
jgi:hypothetical protein